MSDAPPTGAHSRQMSSEKEENDREQQKGIEQGREKVCFRPLRRKGKEKVLERVLSRTEMAPFSLQDKMRRERKGRKRQSMREWPQSEGGVREMNGRERWRTYHGSAKSDDSTTIICCRLVILPPLSLFLVLYPSRPRLCFSPLPLCSTVLYADGHPPSATFSRAARASLRFALFFSFASLLTLDPRAMDRTHASRSPSPFFANAFSAARSFSPKTSRRPPVPHTAILIVPHSRHAADLRRVRQVRG